MKTIAQQLNVKEFPFVIKDSQGRQIYYENSTGYWVKREYDSNGNVIHFENSTGYWCKYEHGSNGKLIYYENSEGTIIDKRPKPCEGKTVEIDGVTYKLTKI
jgi:hypothetical protein